MSTRMNLENLEFYCLVIAFCKADQLQLGYLPHDCLIYMSTNLLNPNTQWGKRRENLVSELKSASWKPRNRQIRQENWFQSPTRVLPMPKRVFRSFCNDDKNYLYIYVLSYYLVVPTTESITTEEDMTTETSE